MIEPDVDWRRLERIAGRAIEPRLRRVIADCLAHLQGLADACDQSGTVTAQDVRATLHAISETESDDAAKAMYDACDASSYAEIRHQLLRAGRSTRTPENGAIQEAAANALVQWGSRGSGGRPTDRWRIALAWSAHYTWSAIGRTDAAIGYHPDSGGSTPLVHWASALWQVIEPAPDPSNVAKILRQSAEGYRL